MHHRHFFNNYLHKTVTPDLHLLIQKKAIDDAEIHQLFIRHAEGILQHYQKQPGSVPHYIHALNMMNDYLRTYRTGRLGYFSLLSLVNTLIQEKIKTGRLVIPPPFNQAIAHAKKNYTKKSNGKLTTVEIHCDADRDFTLLGVEYLNFLLNHKPVFSAFAVNLGLKIPFIYHLMQKRIAKFKNRIDAYEKMKHPQSMTEQAIEDTDIDDVPIICYTKAAAMKTIERYLQAHPSKSIETVQQIHQLHIEIDDCKTEDDLQRVVNRFIRSEKPQSCCARFFCIKSRENSLQKHLKKAVSGEIEIAPITLAEIKLRNRMT